MFRQKCRRPLAATALACAVAPAAAYTGTLPGAAHADTPVVPLPASTSLRSGYFVIDAGTRIYVAPQDAAAAGAAQYLASLWHTTNALTVPVTVRKDAPLRHSIQFRRVRGLPPEGYRLDVSQQQAVVEASTAAGMFYGAVTLWQLLPAQAAARRIPAQRIVDAPRYAWRGLMLDSVRHFQSVDFMHSMIEWMAWHKLNVLQWHLSDDQGWRLAIGKYPKLTSIGAWRIPATVPGQPALPPYGGFYTQEQVREIVAFAAGRHVLVIPEIEMPGHAQAAIAAYPQLGVDSPALHVSPRWGVHSHLFNVEPQTFTFLEDVLDEVLQLFPSPYIHVGGDEAVKDEWRSSAAVQARARALGITDPGALQAYFTQTIGKYLRGRGRRLVGWDEILTPGLARDAVVMSWRGVAGAHAAATAGNDFVLSPEPTFYFDHRQSALPSEPPGRLAVASLKGIYEFETRDPSLTAAQRRHLLGVQANIWTEHIQTENRVEWMSLPRAAAVAEVGWSRARNWSSFLERLSQVMLRYRAFHLNYADSEFAVEPHTVRHDTGAEVTLSTSADFRTLAPDIRFTLDGSDPNEHSPLYATPIVVPDGKTIIAATFLQSRTVSRAWRLDVDAHTGLRHDSLELELCSNGIGLLLEPNGAPPSHAPLAVDIMNPCWILRRADLSPPLRLTAAVAPLPFNYEIGADAAKIRVGDARSRDGELEVHLDDCTTPAVATLPLAPAAGQRGITTLNGVTLPAGRGTHDVCLRFARPSLDPQWVLDWVEIGPS